MKNGIKKEWMVFAAVVAVDFSAKEEGARLVAADDDDLDGFDSFTIEAWTKSDTTASGSHTILSKRWNGGANVAYVLLHTDIKRGELLIGNTAGTASQQLVSNKAMLPAANTWTHQAYVRDTSAGTRYGYLDGVSKTTTGEWGSYYDNTLHASNRPLWLGNLNTDGDKAGKHPFNGLVDELRISKVARSADWIKATHDTMAVPGFSEYSAATENDDGLLVILK